MSNINNDASIDHRVDEASAEISGSNIIADLENASVNQRANGSPVTAESFASQHSRTSLPPESKRQHLGKHRQYWRDIMLGVNDGLVSTFLLVSGVAGGGLSSSQVLLTAIAGAVAGAISMCAGEYVATKSQNQVLQGEIALEQLHVMHKRREELSEVTDLLELIGIPEGELELRSNIMEHYERNPDLLLKIMIALEFGVLDQEMRSPIIAGLTSGGVFVLGSLPSVIPFCFSNPNPLVGLIAAAITTTVSLLAVGAIKSWATRGSCVNSAFENLVIACVGGSLAYGVGVLVELLSG